MAKILVLLSLSFLACSPEIDRTLSPEDQCQSHDSTNHIHSVQFSPVTHEACGVECAVDPSFGNVTFWLWKDC
jgi:hypothetical protein